MVDNTINLFEYLKNFDENFQLIPDAEGHIIFIPCRNPAFLVGKALAKVNTETDFLGALKKSITDYAIIRRYLRKSHNFKYFAGRVYQIIVDTTCYNIMGL